MYKVFLMLQRNLLPLPPPFSLHHLVLPSAISLTTTICRNVLCFRSRLDLCLERHWCIFTFCCVCLGWGAGQGIGSGWVELVEVSRTF